MSAGMEGGRRMKRELGGGEQKEVDRGGYRIGARREKKKKKEKKEKRKKKKIKRVMVLCVGMKTLGQKG